MQSDLRAELAIQRGEPVPADAAAQIRSDLDDVIAERDGAMACGQNLAEALDQLIEAVRLYLCGECDREKLEAEKLAAEAVADANDPY